MTFSTNASAVRCRAQRAGYIVRRPRRMAGLDNRDEFMLVDVRTNFSVLGARYDASLQDIAEFLDA